jgi:hypothetical protein
MQAPLGFKRLPRTVLARRGLPHQLPPTWADGSNFPDTEEVTGSNPVRPTPFFENLSSSESLKGSQPPAVLLLNRWSEHPHVQCE